MNDSCFCLGFVHVQRAGGRLLRRRCKDDIEASQNNQERTAQMILSFHSFSLPFLAEIKTTTDMKV